MGTNLNFRTILVVLIVAGGIAALHKVSRQRESDKLAACKTRIHEWSKNLHWYSMLNKGKYPKELSEAAPSTEHPLTGCGGKPIGYSASNDGEHFRLWCRGHHHQACGLGADLPVYSDSDGPIFE